MPSEAPSSSSSSSSSVLPSSSLFLCETEQETLRDEYGVKAADPCPVCALPVGRHARRPTSLSALLDAAPLSTMMAAVSSPSHSSSHLGKNTTLPKWKVDYHQAKPFLDKIEHLCLADGVDRSVWPRLLLKAIPNVHESSWVVNNIVRRLGPGQGSVHVSLRDARLRSSAEEGVRHLQAAPQRDGAGVRRSLHGARHSARV